MHFLRTIGAVATLAAIVGTPVLAQDHAGHAAQAGSFPDACKVAGAAANQGSAHAMPDPANLKDHQRASMAGMMKMDRDMAQGMMAADPDVAFICGMIAHHQGAIDMADVELKFGKDAWARKMAQMVIDAQTKEIADMTDWLKARAK